MIFMIDAHLLRKKGVERRNETNMHTNEMCSSGSKLCWANIDEGNTDVLCNYFISSYSSLSLFLCLSLSFSQLLKPAIFKTAPQRSERKHKQRLL